MIAIIKNVVYFFIARKYLHIASAKMARIDIIEELHYDGRVDESNKIRFFSFSDLISIHLRICVKT